MMDETGAEDLKFTPEVIDSLSPPKRGRTRPEGGRFAEKQWLEKKERQRLAWEEKVRHRTLYPRSDVYSTEGQEGGQQRGCERRRGDANRRLLLCARLDCLCRDRRRCTLRRRRTWNRPWNSSHRWSRSRRTISSNTILCCNWACFYVKVRSRSIPAIINEYSRHDQRIGAAPCSRANCEVRARRVPHQVRHCHQQPVWQSKFSDFHYSLPEQTRATQHAAALHLREGNANFCAANAFTTAQIDSRVVPLARCLKHWTKLRNINSPYSGLRL